jgi:hypothetical protein
MICTLCKQEIELNLEYQMRNDHAYHECCAMTYDKDEKVNSYHANGCWFLHHLKIEILILGHFFKIKK